ncbi:hypothetical protein LSA36186_05860 [Lachnoanaerobaculum sp. JCM 36186]|nr:hypothetical protein LSA36186_05860 [Lachnoanaerobaculum sp. JCM 36186]
MKIHFVQLTSELMSKDSRDVLSIKHSIFYAEKMSGEISTDARKNCMNAKSVADVHMQRNVRRQIRIELFGSIRN